MKSISNPFQVGDVYKVFIPQKSGGLFLSVFLGGGSPSPQKNENDTNFFHLAWVNKGQIHSRFTTFNSQGMAVFWGITKGPRNINCFLPLSERQLEFYLSEFAV